MSHIELKTLPILLAYLVLINNNFIRQALSYLYFTDEEMGRLNNLTTTRKWQGWDLNPGFTSPEFEFLITAKSRIVSCKTQVSGKMSDG